MTAAPPGWRGIWGARRIRLWLGAAILAAWLPLLGVGLRGWLDFSAFYAAGALAFTPGLASLETVVRFQAAHGLPITPWVYPAGLALLYVPFSWLPYGLAAPLHVVLEVGALVAAAWIGGPLFGITRRCALLGVFAWAPAAAGVVSGQNTALALLLVVLVAWALRRGRPWLGGLAVGLLAYKPQLAAPHAGLLAWRGAWAALPVLAALVGAHYLLGVLATGGAWGWPGDWLTTLGAYAREDLVANGWQAVSLPTLGARLDLVARPDLVPRPDLAPGPPSMTLASLPWLMLAGYVIGGVIVLAALPALRAWPAERAVALAAAVGLVVSPHAFVYDATLLLPAIALFAAASSARGWPWPDRWLLAGGYGLALLWPLGGVVGFVPLVVVVAAAPGVLLGWGPLRRFGVAARPGELPPTTA